jgi:hypothetical protein
LEELESVTDRVLGALASDDGVDAAALTFLLRRYGTSERDDLGDAIERGLAAALATQPWQENQGRRAAWLTLFAEAAAVSDDPRLPEVAVDLMSTLRRDWATATLVDDVTRSIDACLIAIDVFQLPDLVQEAIDRLERVMGTAYQPGEGVSHTISGSASDGGLTDQVSSASALLTAYGMSGRLPYSMLAEELIRYALRTMWDEQNGGFFAAPGGLDRQKPFEGNCEAARALCRLAALHLDDAYVEAAVTAPESDYARDAERTLTSQTALLGQSSGHAGCYGLALSEWLGLQSLGPIWPSTDRS